MIDKLTDELPVELKSLGLCIEIYEAQNLPEIYLDQLIEKSRQPHVMKYEAHEDAEGRFKDKLAFRKWCTERRRIFYLLLEDKNLAGVIWFGERQNAQIDKSYGVTFAIRLYEGFVGRGLSKPFMRVAHKGMKKYYPDQKIWLDFVSENIAAKKAYESFGYKYLGEHDGRIIMGTANTL